MKEYQELLLSLHEKKKKKWGEGFLYEGAPLDELQALIRRCHQELNITLDSGYLDFLEFTNGLDYDGLVIYGSERYQDGNYFLDGFVEVNKEFWQEESLRGYVAYGDENSTRQVFNLKSGRFEIVDRVAWDAISQHDTFDEMLLAALQDHL